MNLKLLLLFGCLFLLPGPALLLAQNNEPDSLKQVLKKLSAKNNFAGDTAYINTLNNLSFALVFIKPDSGIFFSNQASAYSKKINYYYGEAEAFKNLGLLYNVRGNYDSALLFFKLGLEICEAKKFTALAGRLYHNTAIVYTNQGRYPAALENYFKALKMREESGEKLGQSSSNNGIGTVYFLEKKYPEALAYYTKALNIALEIGFRRGIQSGYANIGEINFNEGNNAAAKENLFKALEVAKNTGDLEILAFCKNMLGAVYLKLQQNDSAMLCFKEAMAAAREMNSPEYECRSLIGNGKVFLNTHQPDSALLYVRKGIKIAEDIKFIELLRDGHEALSAVYENKGNGMQALFHAKQFKLYADSMNNQQTQQITANLAADYEYSKKELLLKADFESKTSRQRWIIFSAFAALVSSLVVVWLVSRSRQKEKRVNRLLHHQNEEIEKQKSTVEKTLAELKSTQAQLIQSEKMASLGELTAGIAHEIQNPLNFVNNFSEINMELIAEMNEEIIKGDFEEVKALAKNLTDNEEKIMLHGKRADAIVKGMLQHSRTSTGVKETTDINKLADEYLRLAYHGLRAKDKSFNAQ
jgi:two-component system, NtrC family, sensor kinase